MNLFHSLDTRLLMLRTVRAFSQAAIFRNSKSSSPLQTAFKLNDADEDEELRYRTQKNPVVPNVLGLPNRWGTMDHGQQDDIIAYLEDIQRGDWRDITPEEKRAIWYIYFGPWGPRSEKQTDPGKIYGYFAGFISISLLAALGFKINRDRHDQQTE